MTNIFNILPARFQKYIEYKLPCGCEKRECVNFSLEINVEGYGNNRYYDLIYRPHSHSAPGVSIISHRLYTHDHIDQEIEIKNFLQTNNIS